MFETIDVLLVLVPAMPLLAAVLTAALGKWVLGRRSHLPVVAAIGISFLASLVLVYMVRGEADRAWHEGERARLAIQQGGLSPEEARQAAQEARRVGYGRVVPLWTWAGVDRTDRQAAPGDEPPQAKTYPFRIDVALRADPLTAIMLATVTLISLLVAVYSIGYMHDDPGYWRFFSYIGLFVFSMTMLVSASNFVLLYVFWEAVGLCSYLLIGFWYQKPEAAAAGKKAFLVNRVGDFGFALGVFLIWTTYHTLNFHDPLAGDTLQTWGVLGQHGLGNFSTFYVTDWRATAICLLLMLGACGKSAQFPLHVWLPDAMEGPTPVSALIHAATMVTAGVYMVARCMPLFGAADYALEVVAVVGGFTALLAALIAVTQTDLKRILAYSTISQLGYMFLGLGAATLVGVTAGMFHLFTHAFFKGLLFLGAGSVMHAMGGVIDVRRFGGLRRRLPTTHWTFLFGCLALAGVVPFAGFWSKDLILGQLHGQTAALYRVLYVAAVFTAFLTAFYTFRAFFLTFYGRQRIPPEAGEHAHESPPVMTVPLVVLAVGSLLVGAYFELTGGFADLLGQTPSLAYGGLAVHGPPAQHGFDWRTAGTSTAVVAVGVVLAAVLYLGKRERILERLTRAMDSVGLYRLSHGKFFFDEIYHLLVVWPLKWVAGLSYWVDRYVIDGLVNAMGLVPMLVGAVVRPLQNGMIQFYALAMVLGLLVLIGVLLM